MTWQEDTVKTVSDNASDINYKVLASYELQCTNFSDKNINK